MTFLVYREDPKTGRRFGPYAVRSVRVQGCETPRQEYLGRAVVKVDGTVELKKSGECLGRLEDLQEKQRPIPIKTPEDLAKAFSETMKRNQS